MAAGTSYSNNNVPMIPFYIFYSMFGFQRVGDLAWAAGDMRTRGFLIGGTAGRTTLNGEGLQHEDGHSHILSGTIPNCRSYDPTFGYEVAVVVQDGLKRMVEDQEDVYYYITVMNENYPHPAMPEGSREGILKGMYKFSDGGEAKGPRVQLLGSGVILREVIAGAELLKKVLGTDGFGRSDSRENLRRFFEVNRYYVAVAALKALAEDGEVPAAKVAEAIKKYGIDTEKREPWLV
jgi:pyruvate dehydrogenase E1 component